MGFMKPDVQHFTAYHVETNYGTEIVPTAVAGAIDDHEELLMYCKGSEIVDVEKRTGWYSRLSAAGYMDRTDWNGPHETRDAALLAVKEECSCDDNGDSVE